MRADPDSKQTFLAGEEAPPLYSIIRNAALAKALRLLQREGRDAFYRGDIASMTVIARANSLSGHCRNRPTKVVWIPVRLSDGEIFLRGERITVAEERFTAEREANGGALRIVRLDDLVQ